MKILLSAGLALALVCGPAALAANPAFTCDSKPFDKTVTHPSLVRAFGAANVKRATGADSEGMKYAYSKVFERDAEKEVEVNWFDNLDRNGPHTIATEGKTYWRGPRGVHPGMTLAELEAVNGKPFVFMNVNSDVAAGEVMSWNGGALQGVMQDCSFSVTLSPADPDAFTAKVNADRLTSDDRAVREGGLVVVKMSLVFEPKR
jgi:hypothetical protein